MYEGSSRTLFVKCAIPQLIGLLFNSVYIIVDGVFIGHRLGTDAMAAAAVLIIPILIKGRTYRAQGITMTSVYVAYTAFMIVLASGVL